MENRLESLPDELIERIYEDVHRERYAPVLAEMEQEVLRLLVRRMIEGVMNDAVENAAQ